ncbi:chaperonin 10-like protein [Penicillium malachiteum]|uniref:Chaperonin 10-like protein n=1 Tax=Penicillium malachiteum TaxID=1324776 RepID=A0AAD6HHT9_9EURO|nr:chaperonin 10-like protein [Penicillium malachiteum]
MSGTQKAVIITAPKTAELVTNQPRPSLLDDYILVKTEAVALNPTDWKFVANNSVSGCLVGCDYAGVIEEVGEDVKKDFKKGDRVCGFAHGGHILRPQVGAFAEYILAKGDVQMQIPDNLGFEEAATLGVGIATVGQGLYQSLKLALPTSPLTTPEPLLIYGGSTATGTLAIQYAKLSGYKVLTTCSPHNFELVKNLGADEVYDYKDAATAAAIRAATGDKLKFVFDTISTASSAEYCDTALSTEGGQYSSLLRISIARENINSRATLGYTIMGEDFMIGPMRVPARPDDFAFAQEWLPQAFRFLASGQVKVHPLKVNPDGLKGVPEGLNLMKEGKVSGEKLVYMVSETP